MNDEQIVRMAKWKLMGISSCAKCKFLYFQDQGYSNYTVENTSVDCALDKNPNLPADLPYDWDYADGNDNWPKTAKSRCHRYEESDCNVHLDVDGEDNIEGPDHEACQAISQHSGRPINARKWGQSSDDETSQD